jgi:hypothetical protein
MLSPETAKLVGEELKQVTSGAGGALGMATVLWVLATIGFAIYANPFGNYNKTYAALAGIVIRRRRTATSPAAARAAAQATGTTSPTRS